MLNTNIHQQLIFWFLKNIYLLIITLDNYIYNTTKKHFNNGHQQSKAKLIVITGLKEIRKKDKLGGNEIILS